MAEKCLTEDRGFSAPCPGDFGIPLSPNPRSLCRGVLAPTSKVATPPGGGTRRPWGRNPTSHRPFQRRAAGRRSQASRKPGPSPLPVLASWNGMIRRKRLSTKGKAAQSNPVGGLVPRGSCLSSGMHPCDTASQLWLTRSLALAWAFLSKPALFLCPQWEPGPRRGDTWASSQITGKRAGSKLALEVKKNGLGSHSFHLKCQHSSWEGPAQEHLACLW